MNDLEFLRQELRKRIQEVDSKTEELIGSGSDDLELIHFLQGKSVGMYTALGMILTLINGKEITARLDRKRGGRQ